MSLIADRSAPIPLSLKSIKAYASLHRPYYKSKLIGVNPAVFKTAALPIRQTLNNFIFYIFKTPSSYSSFIKGGKGRQMLK